MRMTQFVGLHKNAEKWLDENVEKEVYHRCPHCNEPLSWTLKKTYIEDVMGMFNEAVAALYKYTTRNGRVVQEVIQCEPWSSGPVIFLCLEDIKTKERLFEWSEEEIAQQC